MALAYTANDGETAASYAKRDKSFAQNMMGPNGIAPNAVWNAKAGTWGIPKAPAPTAPKPPTGPAPPTTPPPPTTPTAPGGGKVVAPSSGVPSSMAALTGGGDGSGGSPEMGGDSQIAGPSKFRQGIGTRMMPQESASLAALKRIY